MSYKIFKSSLLLILIIFAFSACSLPFKKKKGEAPLVIELEELSSESPEPVKTGKLKKFSDYSELSTFLSTNVFGTYNETVETEPEAVLKLDYFKDNNSDDLREADILKQANGFAFVLVKNELAIIRLSELNADLLTKINFDSRPSGILSFGSSLVVYGTDELTNKRENSHFNFVQIFDLSTPANPKKIRDLSFEGILKDIFIEEGRLYVLTEKKVSPKLSEQVLPKVMSGANALASKCDGIVECFAPEVFYFDTIYRAASFLSINVVDLENEFAPLRGKAYLLSENHKAYSSEASVFISYFETLDQEAFYFSAQKELLFERLPELEKNKIKEVEVLPDFVLSQREKNLKISAIFETYLSALEGVEKTLLEVDIKNAADKKIHEIKTTNKTLIHKIRLSKDSLDYYAMGEVSGKMINNYSVLQSGPYVYLATKNPERLNEQGEKRYYISIYVLDSALRLVGKMENLSSKEEIYGVRFLGNRAFLVSAEKNGSLFVISLKDKTKPEFAGTLKVPGSNLYLRPFDQSGEKFIGLSYGLDDSSGFSVQNGIKLSLFDFSDLKNPRELDSYLIGDANSDSLVFMEEKSLYYSDALRTLIFPATFKENNRLYFSGLFIFTLKNDALELKGKLDHSLGGFYNQVDIFNDLSYFDNSVKRSFARQSFVYSFSNKFFRSTDLNNIDTAESLELIIHSDDLLVSSFGVGNPEGIDFSEPMIGDDGLNEGLDLLDPDGADGELVDVYDEGADIIIPEYFEDPTYED